jgi:membrane-associated protein
MDTLKTIIDFILHIDKHLEVLVGSYGVWLYPILFIIVFCETGLVVTPFLPGDSLLFAAGALAAVDKSGTLNIFVLWLVIAAAAILGDTVNYSIGKRLGKGVFKPTSKVLKPEYLHRTEEFFEKHGNKTIILARFVPIVRTFAPFVAGVGNMNYGRFITYNIVGGLLWVTLFLFAGFFIGNIPIIKNNFSLVTIAIILVSVVPMVLELWNMGCASGWLLRDQVLVLTQA